MSIPLQGVGQSRTQQTGQGRFTYQNLATQDTFRLLRLHAGQGSVIDCSLRHHTLGSGACPSYRALSYTWGSDAAEHDVHVNKQVFKVRRNLQDALRYLRDTDSDCWLWIDAICINQNSAQERDQQVRLMADIYGSANVVIAWLSSAGENTNAVKAFTLVRAVAKSANPAESIKDYMKEQSDVKAASSLQSLCELRYWTRKWIIQELILARTVVLQLGSSTCSMADLELLCNQLQTRRERSARHDSLRRMSDLVLASPAARLALQRSETDPNVQPRLLYELTERYSNNECQEPPDHVYALYSLVGDHRTNLEVEYAASPVERLVAVLGFADAHEQLPPPRVLDFANLLVRLFKINQDDLRRERRLLGTLNLVVPVTTLGAVELQTESETSIALRGMVNPLDPIPIFSLDISQDTWVLAASEDPGNPAEQVGRPDMTYFSIANSGLFGLAACRLEQDDTIWHVPGTQLVFATRIVDRRRALIVGRAYLFFAGKSPSAPIFWLHRRFEYKDVRQGEVHVSMDLATLLDMSSLAMPVKGQMTRFKTNEKPKTWVYILQSGLTRHWTYKVVIVCSVAIIALMVAVVITQVVNK